MNVVSALVQIVSILVTLGKCGAFEGHFLSTSSRPILRQFKHTSLASSCSSSESLTTESPMKVVSGVRDLVDEFDVWLLDMWGVMHDGSQPYEGVVDTVHKLKAAGKRLIILSNSSKRLDNSEKMLRKLGFLPNDFEQIITSGEVSYKMLGGKSPLKTIESSWHKLEEAAANGKKAVLLGSGDGDADYLEACGWELTTANDASLVVARGTFTVNDGTTVVDKRDSAEAYYGALTKVLKSCAARQLPMLCCNPDKVRPDAGRPPMPGKLADMYEEEISQSEPSLPDPSALVKRIGKPFTDIYQAALQNADVDRSRICMVGDALETDVTGGAKVGISTVWILMDGIHSPDLNGLDDGPHVLERFNARSKDTYATGYRLQPDYLLANFRW